MKERSRTTDVWAPARLAAALALLVSGFWTVASGQEPKRLVEPAKLLPNSPEEPLRPVASLRSRGVFGQRGTGLDSSAKVRDLPHQLSYLVARPVTKVATPAMAEIRGFFEERVRIGTMPKKGQSHAGCRSGVDGCSPGNERLRDHWKAPSADAPSPRPGVTVQKPDGGFDWLKCGWPPYEHDDYYGAIVAASLGVGYASDGYSSTAAAVAGVKRLWTYFSKNPAHELSPPGHAALGFDAPVEGLMTAAERAPRSLDCVNCSEPTGAGTFPRSVSGNGTTAAPTIPGGE